MVNYNVMSYDFFFFPMNKSLILLKEHKPIISQEKTYHSSSINQHSLHLSLKSMFGECPASLYLYSPLCQYFSWARGGYYCLAIALTQQFSILS